MPRQHIIRKNVECLQNALDFLPTKIDNLCTNDGKTYLLTDINPEIDLESITGREDFIVSGNSVTLNYFDPTLSYYEISFTEDITAVELRSLQRLPYENSIFRKSNTFLLVTGWPGGSFYRGDEELFEEYSNKSQLQLHTHHSNPIQISPSPRDLRLTYKFPQKDDLTIALVHNSGITIYGRSPRMKTVAQLNEALEKEQISSGNSDAEKIAFAKEYEMIYNDAKWMDSSNITNILSQINH